MEKASVQAYWVKDLYTKTQENQTYLKQFILNIEHMYADSGSVRWHISRRAGTQGSVHTLSAQLLRRSPLTAQEVGVVFVASV